MKPTKTFSTNVETLVREAEISFSRAPVSSKKQGFGIDKVAKKLKALNKEKKTQKATKMPQHMKEEILVAKKKQSKKKIVLFQHRLDKSG